MHVIGMKKIWQNRWGFILQPTSPFRKLKTIKEMIKLFIIK